MILQYIVGAALMACAFSGCMKKNEAKTGWVCPVCQCPEDAGCGCSPEAGCVCPPGTSCACPEGNCDKSKAK